MQSFELEQLDRQISSVFKSPAMREKYLELVAAKDALVEKQSSGERERLQEELQALKQAQTEASERYSELSKLAAEKAAMVREIQIKLDSSTGDLSATQFELAVLSNRISEGRAAIKTVERRLREYGGTNENFN